MPHRIAGVGTPGACKRWVPDTQMPITALTKHPVAPNAFFNLPHLQTKLQNWGKMIRQVLYVYQTFNQCASKKS